YPFQGPPMQPGYEFGTRALNRMAYARDDGTLTWHREDHRRSKDATGLYDTTATLDVTFDAPLADPKGPTPCTMKIDLSVAVDIGDGNPPETGAETFGLACTYDHAATSPWIRITANGFENSEADGSWLDYLM